MKHIYKVLISAAFLCSLFLAALPACADQTGKQDHPSPSQKHAQDVMAVISVETEDKLAGLHCEYTIDGILTGGQAIQPLKIFTLGEDVPVSLPPDPDNPPEGERFPFGLYLAVVTKDGTEIPVPVYYQWEARLDTPRQFTLRGRAAAGYTLPPRRRTGSPPPLLPRCLQRTFPSDRQDTSPFIFRSVNLRLTG